MQPKQNDFTAAGLLVLFSWLSKEQQAKLEAKNKRKDIMKNEKKV